MLICSHIMCSLREPGGFNYVYKPPFQLAPLIILLQIGSSKFWQISCWHAELNQLLALDDTYCYSYSVLEIC